MFFALDMIADSRVVSAAGLGDSHAHLVKTMSGCSSLTALHRMVGNNPRIAAYMRGRPTRDG